MVEWEAGGDLDRPDRLLRGDRSGRTKGLALSVACYSIFGGLGSFVTQQEQLLALRFLAGLGIGGVWPNGVALITEFWPDASRPTLSGIFGTSANMGVFVMSQLGLPRGLFQGGGQHQPDLRRRDGGDIACARYDEDEMSAVIRDVDSPILE